MSFFSQVGSQIVSWIWTCDKLCPIKVDEAMAVLVSDTLTCGTFNVAYVFFVFFCI